MFSLFADQERAAKLDTLGDSLAVLDKHMDFAALAAEIDRRVPLPSLRARAYFIAQRDSDGGFFRGAQQWLITGFRLQIFSKPLAQEGKFFVISTDTLLHL